MSEDTHRRGGRPRPTAVVGAALVIAVGVVVAVLWDDLRGEGAPVVGGAGTSAGTSAATVTASASASASAGPRRGDPTYSNVYKYDYVGPDACRGCHTDFWERWRSHPHASMNANANAITVVGAFDGRTLRYGGSETRFAREAGEYVMDVRKGGSRVRRYRVTRTVGSRFVQMYVGVLLDGPEPEGDAVYRREVKLPFAYWIERDEWFPQTYDETPQVQEWNDDGTLTAFYDVVEGPARGEWKRTCALCHNTYPYAVRLGPLGQGQIEGFPDEDVELAGEHRPASDARGAAVLEPWQLVTLGISCESCHFGAREHALERSLISFIPRGEDVVFARADDASLKEAPRQSAYVINGICGQCHRASTQGPTYPDGGASWNSGEARDLAASACASAIKCTDCHDPHVAGPQTNAPPDDPKHLAACTGCHEGLADEKAAADHGRHGANVSCLDCHMPRIVHGLNGMIRTHRIGSPTDPRMLGGDQPNACNLCHLDEPLSWTLAELKKGWGVEMTLPAGARADVAAPVGNRWLGHEHGVVRQVAADAYARSPIEGAGRRARLARVLPLLDDPDPPTRLFARLAVERLLGRRLTLEEYRPWATPKERAASVARLRALEPVEAAAK